MPDASKSGDASSLFAEGADPEADLVLVCGQRKFFVRRAVCDAFKVVEHMPDKSSGAEFDVLGHRAETVEKLLLLVDPDARGGHGRPRWGNALAHQKKVFSLRRAILRPHIGRSDGRKRPSV